MPFIAASLQWVLFNSYVIWKTSCELYGNCGTGDTGQMIPELNPRSSLTEEKQSFKFLAQISLFSFALWPEVMNGLLRQAKWHSLTLAFTHLCPHCSVSFFFLEVQGSPNLEASMISWLEKRLSIVFSVVNRSRFLCFLNKMEKSEKSVLRCTRWLLGCC